MSTESVHAGTPVATQPLPTDLDGGAPLSAEALMIYCQTRLGSLDDDIRGLMDEQRAAINRKEVLTELRSELIAARSTSIDGVTESTAICRAIDAYNEAIEQLPPDDPLRAELVQERNETFYEADADPGLPSQGAGELDSAAAADGGEPELDSYLGARTDLSSANWDAATEAVDGQLERINDDAEIRMIQLQSLMSTRQTAISLTTNLLNKLQKAEDGIVDNIR